ncbi:hypothetical protein AALA98_15605 [Lachnospiraceae bacterium 45-W7]
MGFVFARLQHRYFEQSRIQNFCVKINYNIVKFEQTNAVVEVTITGRKSNEKLNSFFFELLSMMFLYLGSFPKIEKLFLGEQEVDGSKFAKKYVSYSYFERKDSYICEISAQTICEEKYNKFKQIPQMPIYSMQYLVSEHYQYMNITHKVTLLTHIIDGITRIPTSRNQLNQIKSNLRTKYKIPASDEVGNYLVHADIALTPFFKLHSNYNCGIIPFLGKSRYNFLRIVSDTRNWYSHFLKETQKIDRLKSGMEMVIFFELILYCLRIYLIQAMDIVIEKDATKEYLYTVHDWILEIKYGRDEPLKSNTYRIQKGMKEMTEQLRSFVQEHQDEYTIIE